MDRKEFLAQMGLTSAAIFMGTCLGGCSKDDGGGGVVVPPPPTGVDFTINLSDSANAALAAPGGYIYNGGIIIARTLADQYIAVSQRCTHEGFTVVFEGTNNRFYCPNHGSTFTTTGSVTTGPAGSPLTRYNTALTGSTLRVYS
ncbi:MAG TPA: Rieske 2Fe-2S domain-containing protein [Chitinophagaceae bacterium]|jgi:cytochrome b6-f complex iron-sulfur subunit|nr:Rieske 2Fe-2S domain-containing protein [Chitinophagaceae bacterium]